MKRKIIIGLIYVDLLWFDEITQNEVLRFCRNFLCDGDACTKGITRKDAREMIEEILEEWK